MRRSSSACGASPTGGSPVPVGAGAPGSGPQVSGRDPRARAGHRKPLRRERSRGPQHEVKPAASTEEQSGGRAAHVTAKATHVAPVPERAARTGGVRGAARVEGGALNSGGPSRRPWSRRGGSYKPKAKSSAAERESEGLVVPLMVVTNNAAGGKGPCFGHARREGKREGMAGETGPKHPGGREPGDKTRQPRSELWAGAERLRLSGRRVPRPPRGDVRGWARCGRSPASVHAPSRRPSASRVREIRTHGLKGGPAPSPVFTHQE
jgi:hypothetical protein